MLIHLKYYPEGEKDSADWIAKPGYCAYQTTNKGSSAIRKFKKNLKLCRNVAQVMLVTYFSKTLDSLENRIFKKK